MTNCPNCGAPVYPAVNQCPYCDTPYPCGGPQINMDAPSDDLERISRYIADGIMTPNEARRLMGLPEK